MAMNSYQLDIEPPRIGRISPVSGRRLNVLLVEDNAVNQKLAERLLEKQGHSVVSADNGKEALVALENDHFDMVLMDVQMPEMSGVEATAAIRETERATGRHIPIIAMTAHALKGDREQCLEAGMDEYLSKPISAADLANTIERALADRRATDSEESVQAQVTDVLDFNRLLEQFDGDLELLHQISEIFLEELPNLLSQIHGAVKQRDCEALERSAHSLKGAAGNFTLGTLVATAQRLEILAREGNLSEVIGPLLALEFEAERVNTALISLREGAGSV
jgi:two-component system, sensor histidine kinase and response regulator